MGCIFFNLGDGFLLRHKFDISHTTFRKSGSCERRQKERETEKVYGMEIIKRNFRIPFLALNEITRRQLANNERSNKISLSNDCQHVRARNVGSQRRKKEEQRQHSPRTKEKTNQET
jgi:hypothetical protein